jgi:hypothetical protein
MDLNAKLFTSPLQDLQQPNSRDAGKTVAVDRNLFLTIDDIDVVPRFKIARDFRVRRFVSFTQVRKRLSREHDSPSKRVVRAVSFVNGDVVRGVGPLHEDGEVHARRPAADNVDLHAEKSEYRLQPGGFYLREITRLKSAL